MKNQRPLKVLALLDDKPGHISQTQGLIKALAQQVDIEVTTVGIHQHATGVNNGQSTSSNFKPDLVIGAGHRTHRRLLTMAIRHGAFSVVLMKPSLPTRFFGAVICPQHDAINVRDNVFLTQGTINKFRPPEQPRNDNKLSSHTVGGLNQNQHLMLLGGASKLFQWNNERLLDQISSVLSSSPSTSWQILDSRRTPQSFIDKLKSFKNKNFSIIHCSDEHAPKLEELMLESRFTWVTPDSQSMLYESITAGSPTAVFELHNTRTAKSKRIKMQIDNLVDQQVITSYTSWNTLQQGMSELRYPPAPPKFCEADRAAQWLLNRFMEQRSAKRRKSLA